MPIELTCPHCKKRLRVPDRYAGKRGKCPNCAQAVQIPADDDDAPLELAEPHRSIDPTDGYELRIEPAAPPATSQLRQYTPPTEADPTGLSPTDPRLAIARKREVEDDPLFVRELVSLFGLKVSLARLTLLLLPLAVLLIWYITGPGKAVQIKSVDPVYVVEVLDHAQTQQAYNLLTGSGNMALGIQGAPGGSMPAVPGATTGSGQPVNQVYSVGGSDSLLVTEPSKRGDYVYIDVAMNQKTITQAGQTERYDSLIKSELFELRPKGSAPGSGTTGRVISESFAKPIDIELGLAKTTDPHTLLPSAAPDDMQVQRNRGIESGYAEYVVGPIQGKVEFSSSYAYGDMPGSQGLSATGHLTTTHPQGGPIVDADFKGNRLNVRWSNGATGQWVRDRIRTPTASSPWSRHHFGLLFERPAQGGSYVINFAGKDIATVKLDEPVTQRTPAPSPIKSAQPGGPKPASKTAQGPMAYFDVLMDARSQAKGIVSANNMRQIGIGLHLYTEDHQGQFPETLVALRSYLPSIDQLMLNPRTGENPGFLYTPPKPGSDPAQTPILFELWQGQRDLNGAVLYGDGSIR